MHLALSVVAVLDVFGLCIVVALNNLFISSSRAAVLRCCRFYVFLQPAQLARGGSAGKYLIVQCSIHCAHLPEAATSRHNLQLILDGSE